MIFPKTEVRHQNLLTSYMDFPALLSTLRSEGFNGVLEVESPDSRGFLFIDSGEVINAEVTPREGSRVVGREAVRSLSSLAKQKDGVLNIYRLSPERVALVASNLDHEIQYKGLSTDFTRLDGLLLKLKEDKHSGFIEVFTKQNQPMGVLFLEEGEPVEILTAADTSESGFSRKLVLPFIEKATQEGAILNVYRKGENGNHEEEPTTAVGDSSKENLEEVIPVLQEILIRVEKLVDFGCGKKGTFREAFARSLLKRADEYPFLDPFGREFRYEEGAVLFSGEVDGRTLAEGVAGCVRTVLTQGVRDLPRNKMLVLKIRTEIETLLEHHRETLNRAGADLSVSAFI